MIHSPASESGLHMDSSFSMMSISLSCDGRNQEGVSCPKAQQGLSELKQGRISLPSYQREPLSSYR